MQIVPALLTNNADDFVAQMHRLSPYYMRYSIDVLDGKYAPNVTLQPDQIGALIREGKLTMDPECVYDFDLMVLDHQQYIKELEELGKVINIGFVFIHFSTINKTSNISSEELTIGISLDPQDQIDDLAKYKDLNTIPSIQVMTITPGSQGQPFNKELLNKVYSLKSSGYESPIFIDGGVNETTIPAIMKHSYRPDFLCVGSYLSKAENIEKRIHELHTILQ